jgi:hypothetical protein
MRARTLAVALLACAALAPSSPFGSSGGSGSVRGTGSGGAARQGLDRLRTIEQRNRLEDLRTDTRRRLETDRMRARDPAARDRLDRRWRAEDRATDFRRDREREAVERSVDVNERLERSTEALPGGAPTPRTDGGEARDAFDRELGEIEARERVERLQRDAERRTRTGPGVRPWAR